MKRLAVAMVVASLAAACAPSPSDTAAPSTPGATSRATAASGSTSGAPPGGAKRLVIDTDMAPDDIVAIASLLRDPAVEVLAITVAGTGEAHCAGGTSVARSIVTVLRGAPLPVTCGRETPFGDAQPFPDAWRAGADSGNGLTLTTPGFEPDARSAEQLLVELAASEVAAGRKLTVLTTGTLTNLAAALALDPALPGKVTVVSMLGAVAVPGNVLPEIAGSAPPTAEWNAHADPSAVRLVLQAAFDLTLIPLDATNNTPLGQELYRELERDHAAAPADLVLELWAKNPYMTAGDYYLWDPLAAAVVRDPGLVTTRAATLQVTEGAGLDGGRLIEGVGGAPVTIATAADRPAFERFLLAALRQGGPR
jgi:inosine-uridine nucleoside N-ribohydrolase